MAIYNSVTQLIGKTPLVELTGYEKKHNWFVNRDAKLYYFYFQRKGVKHAIVLELTDEMIRMIRSKNYLPRDAWYDEEGRSGYAASLS